ncbi:MAG: fibronectin type III domain-containing protein [Cryomorphaceae bacterium]|nr:fibronectin type III domain-containing protein [Flavobacteriales bacterium]
MSKFFFLGLLSLGLVFTGCNDDDEDDDQNPTACPAPTDVLIDGSSSTTVTLSWVSTGDSWSIEYGESGFTPGDGTLVDADSNPFTVTGLQGDTDYDFYVRNVCDGSTSAASASASVQTSNPLVGTWEAYDVSPVLAGLGTTAITAQFNGDQTYVVTSSSDDAQSTFLGNYSVSEDANEDGIYYIVLNQTDPNSLTSEGIFKVYAASPDSMWYEVAVTDPATTGVTPPTLEGGFGSTSSGAYGNTNIQKYLRQ